MYAIRSYYDILYQTILQKLALPSSGETDDIGMEFANIVRDLETGMEPVFAIPAQGDGLVSLSVEKVRKWQHRFILAYSPIV